MRNIKLIIAILLFFTGILKTFAYTSSDYLNFYYVGNPTWQEIYIIPEGKDLLINFVYADSIQNANLFIADNYTPGSPNIIAGGSFSENKNEVFLRVSNSLWLSDPSSINNFILTGILVNEDEDISSIIDGKPYGINKPIFNEKTIKEIYEYEAVIMVFILLFTFFYRLIGLRRKKSNILV